jgi:hypothetical protein
MENQETPEQKKIRDLEADLLNANNERDSLMFINLKLGYSTRLMSEFHLSQDEKFDVGEALDAAQDSGEVKSVYENFKKTFFNKALDEDSSDFQWSPGFRDKLRHYFAVSLGYDIVSEVRDSLSVITEYFALENKIRTTPDAALRKPMTDKLLSDREQTLVALDKIINIINGFNEDS